MNEDKIQEDKDIDGEEEIVSFENENGEDDFRATINKLRNKLRQAETEKAEYLLGWQRSKADFINAQKNLNEEKNSLITYAEAGLIEDLIPTLDSFFAARQNKESWESVSKEWRVGVEYIEQQLISTLENHGLEILIPIDLEFNHKEHEAVEEKEGKNGFIISVKQPGYKLKGKLIRPARVVVGK